MATDRASEDAMRTSLPGSLPLSSNVSSPNGSGHDLDGMASRSTDEQLKEIRELLLPLVPLARSVANFENHILLTSRVTNIEQIVNTFFYQNGLIRRNGTELQLPHCTLVQSRRRYCLSFERFRLCKILARP